jgi:hypothetical protein
VVWYLEPWEHPDPDLEPWESSVAIWAQIIFSEIRATLKDYEYTPNSKDIFQHLTSKLQNMRALFQGIFQHLS